MKKILLISVMFLAAVVMAGCEKMEAGSTGELGQQPSDKTTSPTTETQGLQPSTNPGAVATISIATANGPLPISVEIAVTDDELAKGLKGRESLAEKSGMWFEFQQGAVQVFTMKDTLIPLDWIYVDKTEDGKMKVVYIKENNTANNAEPYASPVPAHYVLEVKAGTVAKYGIKVGDAVEKRIGPQ